MIQITVSGFDSLHAGIVFIFLSSSPGMLCFGFFSMGTQWLSGRLETERPHRRHYVVVLEQDTFILA